MPYLSMLVFGLNLCVNSQAATKVSNKHTVSIFSPEDGDTIFLKNGGIYLQVHTA
jgi:hypothetical protein